MISDKQFLFIIGSPRSGTTWLQIMLDAHPQVCTTVELTLFSKYTAPWIEAWNKERTKYKDSELSQGLPFVWTEEEFYGFLKEFIQRVYAKVIEQDPRATHILDKHPGYSPFVHDIDRLLPNSRFLHLIRDGRDVAVSMMAAREKMGFGAGTVESSAAAWKQTVLQAKRAGRFTGRYHEVFYEDLIADGFATMKNVFQFCGLDISDADLTRIVEEHRFERMKAKRQHSDERFKTPEAHYRKGRAGTWAEDLSAKQKYLFHRVAGDLLVELGFADHGWWIQNSLQRIFLPMICSIPSLQKVQRRLKRARNELTGAKILRDRKAFS